MSAFGDILRDLVERVPGAVGAVFADWEGEPVDQFAHIESLEIQLMGAQWGVVYSQTVESLGRLGMGEVEELLIEGERSTVLVRAVTSRYFVVLATANGAHLGTARRELCRGAKTLFKEM